MKPGVSSLNPYAASYIPLAKREANDNLSGKDIKLGNETAWFEPSSHFAHNPPHVNASLDSVSRGTEKYQIPEAAAPKNHPAHGSLMQNPGDVPEKQIMDEEFDMDLEFLRMTFSGLSNESLLDVYLANNGDLEATFDMLNQLEQSEDEFLSFCPSVITHISKCPAIKGASSEIYTVESSETLPDTLDIGDVSESGSSATCGALKLKTVAGEASASSSGSAESAVAS